MFLLQTLVQGLLQKRSEIIIFHSYSLINHTTATGKRPFSDQMVFKAQQVDFIISFPVCSDLILSDKLHIEFFRGLVITTLKGIFDITFALASGL